MMIYFSLVVGFFAHELYSTTGDNIVDQLDAHLQSSALIRQPSGIVGIEDLHKRSVLSANSLAQIMDNSSLTFDVKKITIAGQTITRSTPVINDIPTEGVEGILDSDGVNEQFHFTRFAIPNTPFKLSAAECMEKAIAHHRLSTIKNPYVENTQGIYQPLWLFHFDQLRPTFKIRLPTISIFDLKDIYVDAEQGEILRIEDTAQFAKTESPASLFVYSPKTYPLNETELRPVMLKNLTALKEGDFLRGQYMNVRTCCKFYTCPDDDDCTDDKRRCALRSHAHVLQSRELLSLPTATLGLDPMMSLPDSIYVDTVRCTNLPFARAGYKSKDSRTLGFFEVPIDDGSEASEMDRFSEVQAYFSIMSFFNYIRALLNDRTWCLRKEAMSCNSDGSPVVDKDGNAVNPYQVYVNQMIPDMKLDGHNSKDPDSFMSQISQGKGNKDRPIQLNQFARIGNAAFVPALSTLKKNAPRADEVLSDLIKPFDHNVFFQGERDFAYDGDVVFHEFMHAVTTSLISKINSLGLDRWGINSEPGGLNESWSDYFAAAFNEDPVVGKYASTKDGFGEAGLRNIANNASCPNDVIGEIHNDGLIWSGALWEIRSALKRAYGATTAFEFDRAVLATLAQSKTTEDFTSQSEKLLANLKTRDGLLEKASELAAQVFAKRGIGNCFRAYTLSSVDDKNHLKTRIKSLLFVASKTQIGLKNYAPSSSQLEIGVPAGARGVTLSWRQFLGGTGALLGTESTPESTKNSMPLKVLSSADFPITWKFYNAHALPFRLQEPIDADLQDAYFEDGYWHAYLPFSFGRCEQKTVYVSLLSTDFKYVLENINVAFDLDESEDLGNCRFTGNKRIDPMAAAIPGCSTSNSNCTSFWLLLLIVAVAHALRRHAHDRAG